MQDRTPPHSESAEKSLLGSLLTDYADVMESLRAVNVDTDSFYIPAHRLVMDAMLALEDDDKVVNIVSVIDRMGIDGTIDRVGGNMAINTLVDNSLGHAYGTALESVRSCAMKRSIVNYARDIERMAYEEHDPELVAAEAEGMFSDIGVIRKVETVGGVFSEIKADMQAGMRGEHVERAIPTGFPELDHILGGGMKPGGVYYVTGKKGCGKTTFKCCVANQQLFAGRTVSDASLEMTMRQEIEKMAGSMMNCCVSNVINGNREAVTDEKIDRVEKLITSGKLRIETHIETTAQFRAWARREVERFKSNVLMVDYIQLIRSADMKGAKIFEQITECSRAVTRVAKEFNVPVLCVSMMSEEGLWGSRQLDYDAYATLELRTESEPVPPDYVKDVECYFNKNRFGPEHFGLPMKLYGRVGRVEVVNTSWKVDDEHKA